MLYTQHNANIRYNIQFVKSFPVTPMMTPMMTPNDDPPPLKIIMGCLKRVTVCMFDLKIKERLKT